MASPHTLLVRPAGPTDTRTVLRLAALDDAPAPHGEVLIAEVDGQPVAALSRKNGAVVADPVRPTAAVVQALTAAAAA